MVLKRYRGVAAALRDPQMRLAGGSVDEAAHRLMREQARRLYSPEKIAEWSFRTTTVRERAAVELVRDFAEPCSLNIAAMVTGIDQDSARELLPLAQVIFEAGASPDNSIDARDATLALAAHFAPSVAALHTQAFVALTVSLPAFLGNAWLALLENRAEFERIGEPGAVDELLRFAGPARIQWRIKNGQLVELHLADANRDPDEFPDPDRLDLRRDSSGHVALGGGAHACVGGPLVKAATAAVLPAFAQRFRDSQLIRSEPFGGRAIRGHRVYVI